MGRASNLQVVAAEDMTSTGVPITYDTDRDTVADTTTPRLNLLAALQAPNDPPVVAADDATVVELADQRRTR